MNKKDNKVFILGIYAIVAVIISIIVAIVLVNQKAGLNDSFFVSDGTKYVFSLDSDEILIDFDDLTPLQAHIVYFYDGDNIVDMKTYYKFADAATAEQALEYYKATSGDFYQSIVREGQYVILTSTAAEYEGYTTEYVKEQLEFETMLQTMEIDSATDDGYEEEADDGETGEYDDYEEDYEEDDVQDAE